jgi:hypothetical protein
MLYDSQEEKKLPQVKDFICIWESRKLENGLIITFDT